MVLLFQKGNNNFQRTGILKFNNIRHNRKNDKVSLPTYRIKDELEYFIDIYEYDYIQSKVRQRKS